MATCKPQLLAWNTTFLVGVTSTWRVSEFSALLSATSYLVFLSHSMCLQPDVHFLPKIVSDFHILCDIVLPDFYLNLTSGCLLHTLDAKNALLFYLDRTKFPDRAQNLFVSYSPLHQGLPVSSQRLFCWVTVAIEFSYSLKRLPRPHRLTAHSTRAVASSVAFLDGVLLREICAVAILSCLICP